MTTETHAQSPSQQEFTPATDELLYERRGGVAILTFNRPQARNAMTFGMYDGLAAACEHVEQDDRVRVLVLRGAGDRAFVAGTDISQFTAFSTEDDALQYEAKMTRYLTRMETMGKPTIAMLRGYCVGGGAAIAMASDLRVAATDVRFGVPIARTLGNTLSPHNVGRLVDLVGPSKTKELLFTARFMEADEGRAAGLFNEVVPPDELEARTIALAEQIAKHAPLTIRSVKETVRRVLEGRAVEAKDMVLLCYMSEDFKEGVDAFLTKREPRWKGR